MRVILVTSDITYCPDNYSPVIGSLLQEMPGTIVGVVVLKVPRTLIVRSLLFLSITRCKDMRQTLLRNLFTSRTSWTNLQSISRIPIFRTRSMLSRRTKAWLRSMRCDSIVNMRSRAIFDHEILSLPTFGCINIHHGLLPRQRGLFSDLYALAEGEDTGYTIHTMTEVLDTGDILYRIIVPRDLQYQRYLRNVMDIEWKTLVTCLKHIDEHQELPPIQSLHEKPGTLTTTPTFSEIRAFKKNGVIL